MMRALLISGLLMLGAGAAPLLANDSSAEMAAGGLELVKSDAVSMVREDLYISVEEVRVDYVYRNNSDSDVETLVAFPMPVYDTGPYEIASVPRPEQDNFMDFSVTVDGRPVAVNLDQQASAFGVNVTRDLAKLGIPLTPFSRSAYEAVEGLGQDVLAELETRGIIIADIYDVGQGMEVHPTPAWQLQSTYWWRMVFPAGEEVRVSHRYMPAVGATAGLGGIDYDTGRFLPDYVDRYCIDDSFQRAVDRRGAQSLWEQRIAYILMTANNWYGPIDTFHLTIDKGSPDNLVSFCASGVTKTGPTTFEVTIKDFVPERDLDILLLQPLTG